MGSRQRPRCPTRRQTSAIGAIPAVPTPTALARADEDRAPRSAMRVLSDGYGYAT
jgi:hypothetical protein